jgi:hypothetical protein
LEEGKVSKINWVKGELTGKLGVIVGSHWKGHAYTKSYTPPANPNTSKQIENRSLFQKIAHIASELRKPLDLYTRPKPHGMTSFNHLIKLNKPMFNKVAPKWNPLELVIMSGELMLTKISEAYFDSTNFTATIMWNHLIGEPTDKALGVIYDNKSRHIAYGDEVNRSVGEMIIDTSIFANVSDYQDIYAYLAFYRITEDGSGINSGTSALKMELETPSTKE